MTSKIFFCLFQLIIFCNVNNFVNGNPLIGRNVRAAWQTEYTYIVGLFQFHNTIALEDRIMCTGTLVTRYHILTAAHCFDELDFAAFGIIAESNILRYCTIFHPNWWITYSQWAAMHNLNVQYSHDIAFIKLTQIVSEHIVPAGISPITQYSSLVGVNVAVAGWGDSSSGEAPPVLAVGEVTVLSNAECSNYALNTDGQRAQVPARYICTRGRPVLTIESGDSGGPLLLQNNIIAVTRGIFPHQVDINFHIGVAPYTHFIQPMMNS